MMTPVDNRDWRWLRPVLVVMVLAGTTAGASDWKSFRGVETSTAAETPVPTSWSESSNIAWQTDLPGRGLSSPIVVNGRVLLTASSGGRQERLSVLAFDAATGRQLWQRQFWATGRTSSHEKTCNAAPTPTSDGQRIFAFFSSNDLACLDLEGHLLWYRGLTYDYPNASNSLGMASSPVVVDGTVVVMVENDADSFTTGIDAVTGEERWKRARPRMANWTSPTLWRDARGGPELVLVQSGKGIDAIEPATGDTKWSFDDGASTIPSTAVVGGTAYVPSHGVTAIRPGHSTPEVAEIVWRAGNLNPGMCSPVVSDGKVLVISDGGVLSCAKAEDGQREWQSRLAGRFSGSPVIAGGLLYVFNEDGDGFVVDISNQGNVVSTNPLHDTILCTPAIADGALYVRSDRRLWKIAATP